MPQHHERPLDVADLLRQRVRLDKTQENVSPADYEREMRRRMAESKSYAQEQRKLHPTKPPAPQPKPESFLETFPKVPGKVADAVGGLVPDSVKKARIPSWLLPGPPGMRVGDVTRGMMDTAAPIDTSKDATLTSQALRAVLLGLPLGKLASSAGSKLKDAAVSVAKKAGAAIKRGDDKLADAMRKGLGIKLPPKPPKPNPGPYGELLGIDAPAAAQSAAGVARGVEAAAPAVRRGFIGRTIRDPWFWSTQFGVGNGILGLGKGGIDTIAGAGALAHQILNTPEERSSAAPPEAPAKPKDEPIKQEDFDGRKLFGPKGEVPGNDEHGNAVTKPTIPAGAQEADSLTAQYLLNNDADFNRNKTAYLAIKNKIRILQERRIPLEAGLSRTDINRWIMLNQPGLKTPAGVSIFEGR